MQIKETEKKINVLFVVIQLAVGGSERVVLDLVRNLDRSLFNVYVAFFSIGAMQAAFGEVCQGLFHIHKKNGFDLGAMLQISRIIREKLIDVVNAHHYMPFVYSYLGSKILHKRRLVYTEHSVPEVNGISSGKHKYLCRAALHNTDVVVGVSREIADAFKKQFPMHSRKIVSVPNGVDVDHFAVHMDRNRVRAEWGILPEHFVIGMVANFRKVKNHACLIRAFNHLSLIYSNLRLMLVGRGYAEDRENSEEEIKELIHSYKLEDRIIFTGYQGDIPRCLQTFDVFCLPSFSEGLPVSVLEAMAAGVPLVGSDVSGIREVISPEETGLLFASDDDQALAQALGRLITNRDLRDDLRKNAFTFVSEKCGLRQWVSTYEHLFQHI